MQGREYTLGLAKNPIRYGDDGDVFILLGLKPHVQARGLESRIDRDVLPRVAHCGWYPWENNVSTDFVRKLYAVAHIPKEDPRYEAGHATDTTLKLHREVWKLPRVQRIGHELEVDHLEGSLDNRRCVTEPVTRAEHRRREACRRRGMNWRVAA